VPEAKDRELPATYGIYISLSLHMQAEHRSYYCIKTMRTSSRSLEADEEQCTCIVRVATEAGSVLEIEIELLEEVAECVALLFTCRS
jgi:hypothetical protein